MKGNNELHLNQATMIQAMQLWIDHNFKEPPQVKQVKMDTRSNDGREFVVCLGDYDEPTRTP